MQSLPAMSERCRFSSHRDQDSLRLCTTARTASGLVLGLITFLSLLAPSALQAQQPVRPLARNGPCPMGYYGSGDYCVPTSSSSTRGALEKNGSGCPMGFYSSGIYCLSTPSNQREAIPKVGSSSQRTTRRLHEVSFLGGWLVPQVSVKEGEIRRCA